LEKLKYKLEQLPEFNYNYLLTPASIIKNDFCNIWNNITKKLDLDISIDTAFKELKNLVIYEALDGSRSTLNQKFGRGIEGALFTINFMHTLKALGAKKCLIMIHTFYNRKRGKKEFKKILKDIKIGAPLIEQYAIENNICCLCICNNEKHELIDLLKKVTISTRRSDFRSYFLFDYSEDWAMTEKGQNIIKILPEIDVHIRHTKFQFSGGWIPDKMSHSAFLYSQNGTPCSNWHSDEVVALIAIALLAKLLHRGELLSKTYVTNGEIVQRNETRELELFNKVVKLRKNPKKLFMIGSPLGIYQLYY